MKILFKEEKGAVIIMAALMMVVLSGFTALAIDGGILYFHHTKLQDIADACALASCQKLGDSNKQVKPFDEAIVCAGDYGDKNDLVSDPAKLAEARDAAKNSSQKVFNWKVVFKPWNETGTINADFTNANEVKIDITINSNLYFARVLGFNQTPVKVSATARLEVGKFVPLLLFKENIVPGPDLVELNNPPGGATEGGNFGYLDFDDPNMFSYYLENGYCGALSPGQMLITGSTSTPGVREGQIKTAIAYRNSLCKDGCSYDKYTADCPRLVIFPIGNFADAGKTEVPITGFALFLIDDYKGFTLTGYFVDYWETPIRSGRPARLIN